ncbi:MAG: CDP-glycerol glycerophosphotransferase family protein [Paludibacteraceae bacterium]|nr:CDP-glycerol glycerophosphotransferase family protein [Paludibacteraceae bacterium]
MDIQRLYDIMQWFTAHLMSLYCKLVIYPLRCHTQKKKIAAIRGKEKIKILFIVIDLSEWKTESLYERMLTHPRFEPVLGLTMSMESPWEKEKFKSYLESKKYEYIDLDLMPEAINKIDPDIIFYQKPYSVNYFPRYDYVHNLNRIFCYCPYSINTIDESWVFHHAMAHYSWQYYYNNDLSMRSAQIHFPSFTKNLVVTGLPINDNLLQDKQSYPDPWRTVENKRKRIIYAPHHTIGDLHMDGIAYSTFLTYSDFMLNMADKYKDQIQWAFKPHPCLKKRLYQVWGEEKTDTYYQKWADLENTQLETGEYVGLFMHSDAMIHDCASFTIEYHYTQNPVLYLVRDEKHTDNLNDFAKRAFDLHYKARNQQDIEKFINDVIAGNDEMKAERKKFYQECLLPPHGKSASDNIINAILGEEEYK